jgi:hypothetical protein
MIIDWKEEVNYTKNSLDRAVSIFILGVPTPKDAPPERAVILENPLWNDFEDYRETVELAKRFFCQVRNFKFNDFSVKHFIEIAIDAAIPLDSGLTKYLRENNKYQDYKDNSWIDRDYRHWSIKEVWTAHECASLFARLNPILSDGYLDKIETSWYLDSVSYRYRRYLEYIYDAIDSGSLKTIKKTSGADNGHPIIVKVRSADFITWAEKKGLTPPPLLMRLVTGRNNVGVNRDSSEQFSTVFIDLMKKAISVNKISDDSYPSAKDTQEWFKKNWPEGITYSHNKAKMMATFVRPITAGKGGFNTKLKRMD